MPLAKSPTAYRHHEEAMMQALESENGVKIKFSAKAPALNFRHMCHTLRAKQRRDLALEAELAGAALAQPSPFDVLVFRCEPNPTEDNPHGYACVISRTEPFEIEEL